MTTAELMLAAPAAFATEPAPDVSARYIYIPTMPIVDKLLDQGWRVRKAHQRKNDPFASHRIDFDLPIDTGLDQRTLGQLTPTASLYNSHNRTRRLFISIGMHVTICSNQLQVPLPGFSSQCERIHLKEGPDVNELIDTAVNQHGRIAHDIVAMDQLQLSQDYQYEYARKALMTAQGAVSPLFIDESRVPALLVDAHAHQREPSDSLWRTYNIVQENIIEGGRTGRGVHEILRNYNLNTALWQQAVAMLN